MYVCCALTCARCALPPQTKATRNEVALGNQELLCRHRERDASLPPPVSPVATTLFAFRLYGRVHGATRVAPHDATHDATSKVMASSRPVAFFDFEALHRARPHYDALFGAEGSDGDGDGAAVETKLKEESRSGCGGPVLRVSTLVVRYFWGMDTV